MLRKELEKAVRSTGYFGQDRDWLEQRPANEVNTKSNMVESIAEKISEAYDGQDDLKQIVEGVIDQEFEIDFRLDDFFDELKRPKEYDVIAKKCLVVLIQWHGEQRRKQKKRQLQN